MFVIQTGSGFLLFHQSCSRSLSHYTSTWDLKKHHLLSSYSMTEINPSSSSISGRLFWTLLPSQRLPASSSSSFRCFENRHLEPHAILYQTTMQQIIFVSLLYPLQQEYTCVNVFVLTYVSMLVVEFKNRTAFLYQHSLSS